jgi:hypothetical protein
MATGISSPASGLGPRRLPDPGAFYRYQLCRGASTGPLFVARAPGPRESQKPEGNAKGRAAGERCERRSPHLGVDDKSPADIQALRVQQQQYPRCREYNSKSEIEKQENRYASTGRQTRKGWTHLSPVC